MDPVYGNPRKLQPGSICGVVDIIFTAHPF